MTDKNIAGIDLDSLKQWTGLEIARAYPITRNDTYVFVSDVRELLARRAEPSVTAEALLRVIGDAFDPESCFPITENQAQARALGAARAALASPAVPEGYKLVPIKLTEEMHVAAVRAIVRSTGNDDFPPAVWSAMLGASPAVSQQAAPEAPACAHVWNDFGQLGGRNVSWCPRCDTLAWTGKEPAPDAQQAGAAVDLRDWLKIIHDDELTLGDRLQRISSRINATLAEQERKQA